MMDQNRCLLDVINDPQLLQSFLESGPDATSNTNNTTNNVSNNNLNSTSTTTAASNSNTTSSSNQSERNNTLPDNNETSAEQDLFPTSAAPSSDTQFISTTETQEQFHQTDVTHNNNNEVQSQASPTQQTEYTNSMLQHTTLPKQDPPTIELAPISNIAQGDSSPTEPIKNVPTTVGFTFSAATAQAQVDANVNAEPTTAPATPTSSTSLSTMSYTSPAQTPTTIVATSLPTVSSVSTPKLTAPTINTPRPAATTKRAARGGGRATTRTPRVKKAATNNQSTPKVVNHQTLQQSVVYNSSPGPQILIQNPNTGIRQQAILGQTMGPRQTIGLQPQQRLIQIQTPNGPMYFALAPAPTQTMPSNDNSLINQQSSMQQQSQGIRLQSNNTMMLNGQQLSNMQQQQQRISSPFMSNQLAVSNQSLEQNQFCNNSPGQYRNQNQQSSQLQPTQQQSQSMSLQTNSTVMLNGQQVQNVQQQQQRLPLSIMPSQTIGIQNQLDQQTQLNPNQPNQILVQGQNFQQHQGSTGIMVNGQQQQSQQSQQQQMILSSQQQNMNTTMPNQSISMTNQQSSTMTTSQPHHMIMPSTSQSQIMMPRVSNLIINRPLGNPGQLLPGQQQFIQIQTPNGPMLLALPTTQQHHIQNNQNMIDYNSQSNQQPNRMPTMTFQHQQQSRQTPVKQQSNSKPGLNLGDLLLSHGILPEEKSPPISPNCQNSNSQSSTPMPVLQSTPQPMETIQSIPVTQTQPQLQQPVRIAINPDGSLIFPPQIFGPIRPINMPIVATNNTVNNSPLISTSDTSSTSLGTTLTTPTNAKKGTKAVKGGAKTSTTTKRSRSKKNEIEKFPTLKTPCRRQQLAAQQQMQSVAAMIPISVIVDSSNNSITDIKPSISELPQVPIAKIMTPVVQTAALQPLSSGVISTSFISTEANIVGNPSSTNQASTIGPVTQNQTNPNALVSPRTAANNSIAAASGNVDSNPHPTIDNVTSSRLIESIAPISSSTSITSTSVSIATEKVKIEPQAMTETSHNSITLVTLNSSIIRETNSNGIKTSSQHNIGNSSGVCATNEISSQPILRQLEADQGAALNPQIKQPFKSLEDACKRLLRYHVFESPTISEADIEKVDQIFEVAAETLLARKKRIYDKFRLLILKQSMNIVPKAEQVMIDQIFINEEQAILKKARDHINDGEILDPDSLLPTERQETTSLALSPVKQEHIKIYQDDNLDVKATDFLAYGDKSPELHTDNLNNLHQSPSKTNNWLMSDKWNKSRFSSVPDSEAALAIESILDDELS